MGPKSKILHDLPSSLDCLWPPPSQILPSSDPPSSHPLPNHLPSRLHHPHPLTAHQITRQVSFSLAFAANTRDAPMPLSLRYLILRYLLQLRPILYLV